jgi:hypothetical protein
MAGLARMIRNTPAAHDPAETEIPRPLDDPAFARESGLLDAFRRRLEDVERERSILELEHHLQDRPAKSDGELRWRLRKLKAECRPPAPAAPSPVELAASNPAIARGLAILAGEAIAQAPDFAARMRELDQQRGDLAEAVNAQTEVCDEIAGVLGLRFSKELAPAWNALQIEMYRAAQELARAARRVREFRARITAAGIRPRSDILAMPAVRAPLMLGDETSWDSEISSWRRLLETGGIL